MTLNSIQPGPESQASRGAGVTLAYPALDAGDHMTVWLEWSANPTNVAWDRPQQIALDDDGAPLVALTRHVTVFP